MSRGLPSERVSGGAPVTVLAHSAANATVLVAIAERLPEARPIPRSRTARLSESKRRLEEELQVEREANAAYEAYRAAGSGCACRGRGC